MEILMVKSLLDDTEQKSLFYPAKEKNKPLLVALHTWSFDEKNQEEFLLSYVQKKDWNLLLPRFRGPNKPTNPDRQKACGSKYAISDIIEATNFVLNNYDIDKTNVFLFGGSGGGQACLLSQAYAPNLWTKAIAYVPIFDLKAWLDENLQKQSEFAIDIVACVGEYKDNVSEYKARSPLYYVQEIAKAKDLKIYVGKYDDIVSYKQGVEFFNKMMLEYPESKVFFEFFDGGHFVNYEQIIAYFDGSYSSATLDLSK